MRKRLPEFLPWFGIFCVLHFLICTFLTWMVSRLYIQNGRHLTPMIMMSTLPLNLLSLPMRIICLGLRAAHFSEWIIRAMQILNSVIWGAGLGMVALNARRGRE
jgi:hypothetical protein